MALCSVEIRALPHMMQAEPAGTRCLEEEELRSPSSPFLLKNSKTYRLDLGSQLIHKNPETSCSIMCLFICRIAFHPAMVAHVSLNLFENKVQVLTVLGTEEALL